MSEIKRLAWVRDDYPHVQEQRAAEAIRARLPGPEELGQAVAAVLLGKAGSVTDALQYDTVGMVRAVLGVLELDLGDDSAAESVRTGSELGDAAVAAAADLARYLGDHAPDDAADDASNLTMLVATVRDRLDRLDVVELLLGVSPDDVKEVKDLQQFCQNLDSLLRQLLPDLPETIGPVFAARKGDVVSELRAAARTSAPRDVAREEALQRLRDRVLGPGEGDVTAEEASKIHDLVADLLGEEPAF